MTTYHYIQALSPWNDSTFVNIDSRGKYHSMGRRPTLLDTRREARAVVRQYRLLSHNSGKEPIKLVVRSVEIGGPIPARKKVVA